MGVFDLFSKRQRRARGEMPDVYSYDEISNQLRVQVIHIIKDSFGTDRFSDGNVAGVYGQIKDTLCREYGLFQLAEHERSDAGQIFKFLLAEKSAERALDLIELSFKIINTYVRTNSGYQHSTSRKLNPDNAIAELNERFKEHGVGYRFESNELIRIDSEYLHAEAVKPVLVALRGKGFEGANEEFLNAHEHYRHSRHKECLVDALKAFESTMKAIGKLRKWNTQPTDTAKALIAVCFEQGLLPTYLESQLGALRALLESGVPTIRNKLGGHGQGSEPITVPEYFTRYALNLTASCILFLVDAHGSKK